MIAALVRLWRGDLPLSEAVWVWGALVGLPINIFTSIAFLWLITLDEPVVALLVGNLPSIPYNVICAVGIWRAAQQIADPMRRTMARGATVVAAVLLSAT